MRELNFEKTYGAKFVQKQAPPTPRTPRVATLLYRAAKRQMLETQSALFGFGEHCKANDSVSVIRPLLGLEEPSNERLQAERNRESSKF